MIDLNAEGGYEWNLINLYQYKKGILFIFYFIGYDLGDEADKTFRLGSYPGKNTFNECLFLEDSEEFDNFFDFYYDIK